MMMTIVKYQYLIIALYFRWFSDENEGGDSQPFDNLPLDPWWLALIGLIVLLFIIFIIIVVCTQCYSNNGDGYNDKYYK